MNLDLNLNFSTISNVSNGLVKLKGKLKAIELIESPISKKRCIGYNYTESYSHARKKNHFGNDSISRERKTKITKLEIKCNNFYLEDDTGRIKIIAKDINIFSIKNQSSIEPFFQNTMKSETLLLEDENEYVIVGTAVMNKKGEFVIKKKKEEFYISDLIIHRLLNHKLFKPFQKYGGIVILIIICLVYFIFFHHLSS
jgi:hypothetical protein